MSSTFNDPQTPPLHEANLNDVTLTFSVADCKPFIIEADKTIIPETEKSHQAKMNFRYEESLRRYGMIEEFVAARGLQEQVLEYGDKTVSDVLLVVCTPSVFEALKSESILPGSPLSWIKGMEEDLPIYKLLGEKS